eukprot:1190320-Prorocentrum_minimum.AAC.2
MFRGKLNAPRVEWLNKGFMAVWSPIIVGRRKKRRVSQHTRCNGRRTLATCQRIYLRATSSVHQVGRVPIAEGEREYTRSGHQSQKGRENIPVAGTNHRRGERTYPYRGGVWLPPASPSQWPGSGAGQCRRAPPRRSPACPPPSGTSLPTHARASRGGRMRTRVPARPTPRPEQPPRLRPNPIQHKQLLISWPAKCLRTSKNGQGCASSVQPLRRPLPTGERDWLPDCFESYTPVSSPTMWRIWTATREATAAFRM